MDNNNRILLLVKTHLFSTQHILDIEPVAEHIEIDEILHWPLRISYRQKRKGANGGNFRMNMKVHGQILVKFHEEPRAEKFESQREKESA